MYTDSSDKALSVRSRSHKLSWSCFSNLTWSIMERAQICDSPGCCCCLVQLSFGVDVFPQVYNLLRCIINERVHLPKQKASFLLIFGLVLHLNWKHMLSGCRYTCKNRKRLLYHCRRRFHEYCITGKQSICSKVHEQYIHPFCTTFLTNKGLKRFICWILLAAETEEIS